MDQDKKVKSFLDLEIYQIAEAVAVEIDTLCRSKEQLRYKFKLVDQLVDAAVSMGSNIAEGFGRYHFREYINFLYYTRGSIDETVRRMRHFWLMKDFTDEEFNAIMEKLRRLHVKVNNSITSTRKQLRK